MVEAGEAVKQHLNLVFMGKHQSGKSSLAAQLLVKLGFVSLHEIQAIEYDGPMNIKSKHHLLFDYTNEEREKNTTIQGKIY